MKWCEKCGRQMSLGAPHSEFIKEQWECLCGHIMTVPNECARCGYEVAEYRPQWNKILCRQCDLDFDSPSQEVLESRI